MLTMATRKTYFAARSHRFLPVAPDTDSLSLSVDSDSDSAFEFHESEIYDSGRANSFECRGSLHGRASGFAKKKGSPTTAPASVPVNIPDWSKILGGEYHRRRNSDEENEENSVRVPPHEFLARTRVASFSVHEGVGRTLKGRDLSTLRNAIWAKTGFQD
ncbi:uncharacterized protein LOC109799142 [Cajanus cajan]|nr:uncharacterized protein LOC109799118 [Cajanus cajan]XP_020215256.1 uncharacterized protein LOC109799142 [Cajanus cajan]